MKNLIQFHVFMTSVMASTVLFAQVVETDFQKDTLQPKRFIDKVEFIAGAGFLFNYGNKFLSNYEDDNIKNTRKIKSGYSIGVGVYHPVKEWLDINASFLFEKKGSKTELNVPLSNGRLEIGSEYNYNYYTIALNPQILLGIEKKVTLSLGGYYSIIKSVKGSEIVYDTQDKTTSVGNFTGRSLRGLDNNGHVVSLTYIPGLQSFEKHDYGIILSCGYLLNIKRSQVISVKLVENLGLQNINKLTDGNVPEKNHSVSLVIGYILKRKKSKSFK